MAKKSNSKTKDTPTPLRPTRVEAAKKIKLKEDHLKLLQDLSAKEKEARNNLSFATIQLFQLKEQLRQVEDQISTLEGQQMAAILEEIARIRNRMADMGKSMMDFYDLDREKFEWRLDVEKGAWTCVPKGS